MNKFRLGDGVIINNPSSKFHGCKGIITNINCYTGKSTWVTVEIRMGNRTIQMLFPDYKYLKKAGK